MESLREAGRIYGPEFAKADAQGVYNDEIAGVESIRTPLTEQERAQFTHYTGLEVRSTQKARKGNDHILLQACNEIIEKRIEAEFPPQLDFTTTLHVGATAKEVTKWWGHKNHEFYLHLGEDKDWLRCVQDIVRMLGNRLKDASSPQLRNAGEVDYRIKLSGLDEAIKFLEHMNGTQKRIHLTFPDKKYSTLVFGDSIYSMDKSTFLGYFKKTGALHGYAKAFFPDSFITKDVAPSKIYREEYTCVPKELSNWFEKIWPGGLAILAFVPIAALENTLERGFRWLINNGQSMLVDWVLGALATPLPFVTLACNMFDVVKFMPVVNQLLDYVKQSFLDHFQHIRIAWIGGFSTGYSHHRSTWSNYIQKRRFHDSEICVDWEVKSRVGEMYKLDFSVTDGKNEIVFPMELPPDRRVVKVARLMSGYNPKTAKFSGETQYFNVLEKDWFKVYNWALSEPVGSLDPAVVSTAVVRVKGGLSLNSSVIVMPMQLQDRDVSDFVLAILLEVYKQRNIMDMINNSKEALADYQTNLEMLLGKLALGVATLATGGLIIPAYHLYKWLVSVDYHMCFVKYMADPSLKVQTKLKHRPLVSPKTMPIHLRLPTEKKLAPTGCFICDLQQVGTFAIGKDMSSTQEFICNHRENRKQPLSVSVNEATEILNYVRDERHWHEGRAGQKLVAGIKAFEDWLEANSGRGITFEPVVHYIEGGPGTGKSVVIREMMHVLRNSGVNTSVMFPFKKLTNDYTNVELLNTKKLQTFEADTTWWATLRSNVHTWFLDEFTATDHLLIRAMGAYIGVQEIYLVGDTNQTKLNSEGGEGMDAYTASTRQIGGWDFDEITKHRLVWNWRNPPWQVKAMNKALGLSMKSKRTDFSKVPRMVTVEEYKAQYANNVDAEIVFSHATANEIFGKHSTADRNVEDSTNMSVRSSQGQSHRRVAVSAALTDRATKDVHGQMLVAFSRNREQLVYVTENSVSDEVPNDIARFWGFHNQESIDAIEKAPWPVIELGKKIPKYSKEQVALGSWLREKKALGDLIQDISEDEGPAKEESEASEEVTTVVPGKPVASFVSVDPATEEGWADKEKALSTAKTYYTSGYNFCFDDVIEESEWTRIQRIQFRTLMMKAFKARLSAKLDAERNGLPNPNVPWPRASNGKENIPISVIMAWAKICRIPLIMYNLRVWATPEAEVFHKRGDYVLVVSGLADHATISSWEKIPAVKALRTSDGVYRKNAVCMETWHNVNDYGVRVCDLDWDDTHKCYKPTSSAVGYSPTIVRTSAEALPSELRSWDLRHESHQPRTSSYKAAPGPLSSFQSPIMKAKKRFGTDVYKMASLIDPSGAYLQSDALNYPGMVRNVHRPGRHTNVKLSWEGFIFQRTANTKVIRDYKQKEYRSFLPGMVNHFNDSPEESLNAASRLGQLRKKPALTSAAKMYAERIAKEAFEENWYPNFKLDELEVNACIDKALKDMRSRNYAKRGVSEIQKRGYVPLLTFSNKDQVKPMKDGKLDLGKSGQGILQSPAYIAAEFAPWMRVNNLHFRRAARPHFFYENLVTAQQFNLELTSALRSLPECSRYGIADGEEFDSWQNSVTLHAEKEFRRLQGACSESIAAYYQIRGPQEFTMFGCFRGRTNFEKGSGFLDTLLGNTTLAVIAGHQMFKGVGPKVVASKGDDYMHAQAGLTEDVERRKHLECVFGMKWKVSIGNGGEFCGNSVSRAGCYPSIVRAALKAISGKSRDYKHFTAQQQAYRDKVDSICENGLEENIAANVLAEGRTEGYVRLAFEFLNSVSHISKEQWESSTKLRKNPRLFLNQAEGPTML